MASDKDFEPFSFWKGAQDVLKNKDGAPLDASEAVDAVRTQLGDALNARIRVRPAAEAKPRSARKRSSIAPSPKDGGALQR